MADEELIEEIAKAIEGPYLAKHIGWDKLLELRDVKWDRLSAQEKGVKLSEARSVATTLKRISHSLHDRLHND